MNFLKIAAVAAAATAALHANAATETFDSTPVFSYTGGGTIESTSIPGYTAMPVGSSGNWLSVGVGATETVSLGGGYSTVGFLWGSVDYYNVVTFYSGSTELASFDGSSASAEYGMVADGSGTINFSYSSASPITGLTLSSTTSNAFEVDNISAAAVPEPESYALMLAGLGAMAFLARRRQS